MMCINFKTRLGKPEKSKMGKKIDTIIFDIGNVIVSFDHNITCRKLAESSYKTPEEIYDFIFNNPLIEDYDRGKISSQDFFNKVEDYLKSGISFADFFEIWGDIFELNRGIEALIEELRAKVSLFSLSNTNDIHYQYLIKKFPVFKNFKEIYSSHFEGYKKPANQIYSSVLKKIGEPPENILFVDDIDENVRGFKKFGVEGIEFRSNEGLKKSLKQYGL